MRLAHLSDIHFGRISERGIVDALVADLHAAAVDLVAVSGDLTQRAFPHQFRQAAALLERFNCPVVVVPGNHDVFPWWRPALRLGRPLRRYRKLISDDLAPQFVNDEVAVLGLNSAFGQTIKGGRITATQRALLSAFFEAQPRERFKVLVVHHHLQLMPDFGGHDIVKGGPRALKAALEGRVDLILCGHLHVSMVESIEAPEHRLVIASAGTATSSRGRKSSRRVNHYNLIDITPDQYVITERRFDPGKQQFEAERSWPFSRAETDA